MPLGPSDFTLVGQSINNHNASPAAHADIRALIPMPSKSLSDYANVVVVDAGGNGDYTTQAAAAAAITDDDASHIYNVFVYGVAVDSTVWSGRPFINVFGYEAKREFIALFSQSGTDNPNVKVFKNTMGGDAVWTREDVGLYKGVFPSNTALITSNTAFFLPSVNQYIDGGDTSSLIIFGTGDGHSIIVSVLSPDDLSPKEAECTGYGFEMMVFP